MGEKGVATEEEVFADAISITNEEPCLPHCFGERLNFIVHMEVDCDNTEWIEEVVG
jgi:hypothetical protein